MPLRSHLKKAAQQYNAAAAPKPPAYTQQGRHGGGGHGGGRQQNDHHSNHNDHHSNDHHSSHNEHHSSHNEHHSSHNEHRSSHGWGDLCAPGHTSSHSMDLEFKEQLMGGKAATIVTDMKTGQCVYRIMGTFGRDFRGGHRVIIDPRKGEVAEVGHSRKLPGLTQADAKKMAKKKMGMVNSGLTIFDSSHAAVASMSEDRLKMGKHCTLSMADGRKVEVEAASRGKAFTARSNGQELFKIDHKKSAGGILLGKDTYTIHVQGGVDHLFASCVCLIVEELFRGSDQGLVQKYQKANKMGQNANMLAGLFGG